MDKWGDEQGANEIDVEQLQEAPCAEKDIVQRIDEKRNDEADSDMKDFLEEVGEADAG